MDEEVKINIKRRMQRILDRIFKTKRSISNYIRYIALGVPDGLPLPSPYALWLVLGTIDAELFIKSGDNQFNKLIIPLLRRNNIEIDNFHSILDFGCGCGRLTRWFHPYTEIEIWGTDNNEKLVRWCQKKLNFAQFSINQSLPPLIFENNKFDFILIRSVFTHISEKSQRLWLEEFCRIISPNGVILFTVAGDNYLPILTAEESALYRKGNFVIRNENFESSNKCATFHPTQFVYRMLSECGFEVIDKIPGETIEYAHQDTYLARKSLSTSS